MINGAPSLSLNLRNLTTEQQYRLMEIGLQVLVERGLTLTDVAHVAQVFERAKTKATPAEAGRLGGLARTPAKRKASGENGKLGGRPNLTPAARRALAKRMSDLWKAGKISSAKIERAKRRNAKATKAYKLTEAQRARQRERNQRYQANLKLRLAEAERLTKLAEQQQGGGQ